MLAPARRGEIAKLADQLRGLINMIETGEMSAATALTYRLQGAVVTLEAALGFDLSVAESRDE